MIFNSFSMLQRLKIICKTIEESFPYFGIFLRRIKMGVIFNKVKKNTTGGFNKIYHTGSILNNVTFNIDGSNNTIVLKWGSILTNVNFYILGSNNNCYLCENIRINRGADIIIEGQECCLTIGERTTFEGVHLALTECCSKIVIGSDCMFAYDIEIRNGDSHSIISNSTGCRINDPKDVFIGNHVWVASHAILLKGTVVKDNSIVATAAVVTKPFFEEGIIVGGNPARKLKSNINWCRERV